MTKSDGPPMPSATGCSTRRCRSVGYWIAWAAILLAAGWAVRSLLKKTSETAVDNTALPRPMVNAPYVRTSEKVVERMLELAQVGPDDVVYDLGCGDGRIVVAAAKKFGCRGFGYDIDPERVAEARENARRSGVEHLVQFEQRDIFTLELSPASVVTLYLLPRLNVKLIPQLEKLAPGARIVSHDFDIAGIEPDEVVTMENDEHDLEAVLYLWKAPLKQKEISADAKRKH